MPRWTIPACDEMSSRLSNSDRTAKLPPIDVPSQLALPTEHAVAVWQFNIAFLPQDWLDAGGDVSSLFAEGTFDATSAWWSYRHPKLEETLGSALSKGKSWHPDLTVWGSEQTDDIQLWRSRGKVNSVVVRFDLRQPNMTLLQQVILMAQELDLAIVALETRSVVQPDVDRLLRAAAESRAAHFVLDPASFLLQAESANTRAT